MAQYTTVQLATLCQRSERTVQLWIQRKRLRAQRVEGTKNRYIIEEADLAPFLPHEAVAPLIERIEALEIAMGELRGIVAGLSSSNIPPKVLRPAPTSNVPSPGNLPAGMVPVYTFYHNVPANTARRLLEVAQVAITHGHWISSSGHHFDRALDAGEQLLAYNVLHTHPRFQPCAQCPHTPQE